MKNRFFPSFFVFSLLVVVVQFRCSTDPVAGGGGTHTGNPAVVACTELAFEITDQSYQWHPDHFVDRQRLNPHASLFHTDASSELYLSLNKRNGGNEIQTNIDTLILIDTQLIYDTVYLIDTLYDTVLITSDTTFENYNHTPVPVISDSVTIKLVVFHDTVIHTDSLFIHDTLFIEQVGEKNSNDSSDSPTAIEYFEGGSGYTYRSSVDVPLNQRLGDIVVDLEGELILENYQLIDGIDIYTAYLFSSRKAWYTTEDSASVFVAYKSQVTDFSLSKYSVINLERWLTESYESKNFKKEMLVHFNAGDDERFSETHDNTIMSIFISSQKKDHSTSEIVYIDSLGTDTLTLQGVVLYKNDNRYVKHVENVFIPHDSVQRTAQAKLQTVKNEILYRKGTIDNLSVDFTPPQLIGKNEELTVGYLNGIVRYSDGREIEIQGDFDRGNGFTGTIDIDGVVYSVRCGDDLSVLYD